MVGLLDVLIERVCPEVLVKPQGLGLGPAPGQGPAPRQGLGSAQEPGLAPATAPGQGLAGSLSYRVLRELGQWCRHSNMSQGQGPRTNEATTYTNTNTAAAAVINNDNKSVGGGAFSDARQALVTCVLGQLARQSLSVQSQMTLCQLILQTYGGAPGLGLGPELGLGSQGQGLGSQGQGLALGQGQGLGHRGTDVFGGERCADSRRTAETIHLSRSRLTALL